MTFKEFNLHHDLVDGLDAMNITTPTSIQEQAIPVILQKKDLIACAQTGTGKTAAFIVPILNQIIEQNSQTKTTALIIVPTRELAMQIDQQVEGFSYFVSVSSIALYGGGNPNLWVQQKNALKEKVNIIIATPGRLLSYINLQHVDFSEIQFFVLDEADRMLDMGFLNDIIKVNNQLPKEKQTLLFSATMPTKIRLLAKKLLKNPQEINIAVSKPADKVVQVAYVLKDEYKIPLLINLMKDKEEVVGSTIIFTSRKKDADIVARSIAGNNIVVKSIHSDLQQSEREDVLRQFKNRKIQILVATDILSRGIDIDSIDTIINYDIPNDAEDYIHRVGRTARADASGVAISFINKKDQHSFFQIEQLIEEEIFKIPLPPEIGKSDKYNPASNKTKKKFYHYKKKENRKGKRKGKPKK